MNQDLPKIYSLLHYFRKGVFVLPFGSIIQVEELSLEAGSTFPIHAQSCDEITCVISGSATSFCGSKPTLLTKGDIHYIRPGNSHHIKISPEEPFRFICIGFVIDASYAPLADFNKSIQTVNEFVLHDEGDIHTLAELLLNEFYIRDSSSNMMINHYLTQIIILISRLLANKSNPSQKPSDQRENQQAIYQILRYIDRNYLNITSVKSIVNKFPYSEYYFSHMFKDKVGITAKEYITQKKIAYAEKLLKNSDLSMEDIAEELNFSSAHCFYQAFRKCNGLSPMQFRKQKK